MFIEVLRLGKERAACGGRRSSFGWFHSDMSMLLGREVAILLALISTNNLAAGSYAPAYDYADSSNSSDYADYGSGITVGGDTPTVRVFFTC